MCPICHSLNIKKLISLDCGNFDSSKLYQNIHLFYCKECSHVFNVFENEEDVLNLKTYYNDEYAPINLSHNSGDMYSQDHYDILYHTIDPYINKDSIVLDVGCNTGGFIKYLNKKGIKNTYGIDWAENFIKASGLKNVQVGEISPFISSNKKYDLIVMDQTLEHSTDPVKDIYIANTLLENEGYLYISVPEVLDYYTKDCFPFYWLIMREHLHHFDDILLKSVLSSHGFEIIHCGYRDSIKIGDYSFKSVNILAKKVSNHFKGSRNYKGDPLVYKYIKKYILKSEISLFKYNIYLYKKMIKSILSKSPIALVGVGRECLFLLKNSVLKYYNNIVLSDSYKYKQQNMTVNNHLIADNDVIKNNLSLYTVIITAFSHIKLIDKYLKGK